MPKKSKMSASLRALAALTNTDPNNTSQGALEARSRARANQWYDEAGQRWDDMMFNPDSPFGASKNMLTRRPNVALDSLASRNPRWGAFLEAAEEAGERQGKETELGEIPGLASEDPMGPFAGTVPLALQGLRGVRYATTEGGRPIGIGGPARQRKKVL